MLKMKYLKLRLLLGVLLSKKVYGILYILYVRGSFKLSTGGWTVLPKWGRHARGYPFCNIELYVYVIVVKIYVCALPLINCLQIFTSIRYFSRGVCNR